MSRYELLLFAHIVAVVVWVGTGTAFALIGIFGDRELVQRLGPLGAKLAPRVFAPSALGTLIVGILLVLDGDWSFRPLWIRLGFAAFAVSFFVNVAVRAPLARRMARGDVDPRRGSRLLSLLARVELTVLYLTIADMVSKPTSGDTWTLVAGSTVLAAVVLGAAFAALPVRNGVAAT